MNREGWELGRLWVATHQNGGARAAWGELAQHPSQALYTPHSPLLPPLATLTFGPISTRSPMVTWLSSRMVQPMFRYACLPTAGARKMGMG